MQMNYLWKDSNIYAIIEMVIGRSKHKEVVKMVILSTSFTVYIIRLIYTTIFWYGI